MVQWTTHLKPLVRAVMERVHWMDPSLKARLAHLGPIRAVDLVSPGSPATIVLRLPPSRAVPKTVDAAMTLARRGLSLLVAKRTMEDLLLARRVFVSLPMVEDIAILTAELAECGIAAAPGDPSSGESSTTTTCSM